MAASLALKLFIVLIFLNILTQVTLFKRVIYTHKNIVFKDPVGLIVDGLVSRRYGLIFPINYHRIILRRSNYESNFKVSRAVSKSTKHGYTSLILPTKPFKTDLTICVDVSSNPGPDNSERNTCRSAKQSSKCASSCLNAVNTNNVYKPSFLRSLRSSPSSKYIDTSLYNCLVSLGILRPFRGCRSGRRVKERNYLRDQNSTRAQYGHQICISPNQNNTPSYNHPSSCFADIASLQTSRRREFVPSQVVQPNTRNLNNLTLITPNKPENHNLTRADQPIETDSISVNTGLIKVIHLNIRSLRNNVHLIQLRELVRSAKFDIITISETWLNTSVTSAEVNMDGYKLIRLDRLHKRGGGVCAYIRKDFKTVVLKDLSYISERNFHQLWISVQCKKTKSVVICVTYRPDDSPLSSFDNVLKPSYIQALTLNKPIVILGDLNCDVLKQNCPESKALINFAKEMNLSQLIKSPTRITNTTQSLLDVVLVSSNSLVRRSGVLNTTISDHLPVYVELKLKSRKHPPHYITVRSYKNYSPSLFITDLARSSHDSLLSIFNDGDVNTMLDTFNQTIQSTLDSHAPIKTVKVRSRPCPFVTQDIKDLMKTRDQLHRRYLQTRDDLDWSNFKDARKAVKRKLKDSERNYYLDEVQRHKNNPGSLWKIINQAIPSKSKEKQTYTKDPKTVADEFNQFFSSVGKNTADASIRLAEENNITVEETPLETVYMPSQNLFSFRTVTSEEVRRVIASLPLNKSPGPDKINSRILKDCLPVILGPLTHIINCSITSHTFPTAWKEAEVIPIVKDGDHEVASNNRPISLLAIASKVCEKIVLEQFSSYLISKNLLSPHQSGNKKLHSTETLNIFSTDTMLEAMDKKELTALVLLDLSKAFDSINHHRLLHKLANVGASPATVQWFKSYLSDRFQSTRINSTLSDPLPITHGVPQGATLSPLLFCIYLNDLPSVSRDSNLESYVDDSKVLLSFPLRQIDAAITNLEQDLHRVASWCCENHLLINPGKTKYMMIGSRQLMSRLPTDTSVSFLGKSLKPVDSAKDLGVTLDRHLNYDKHVSLLVSSCMNKLCQINRAKNSFDTKTLSEVISSLVISKMVYCSSVWSNTSASNVKKVQSIQNFACKIITKSRKYDHVTPLLRELNWLPVDKLLYFRDASLTYKCVNNLAPDYLCNKLIKRSSIHDRRTRTHDSLQIPLFKTAAGQRSFAYRAVHIWNNLDKNLKDCSSLKIFKVALKKHLLAKDNI